MKKPEDYWKKQVPAALKRLKKFHDQGETVVDRYLDERETNNDDSAKLNLFHKNVKTLLSMLYGQTPRIDVSREHDDPDDDVARVASTLLQRILQADVSPSGEDSASLFRACLQDRLLPGLGQGRATYKFKTAKQQDELGNEFDVITNERSPVDYVHWNDFIWGWGRTWQEIPWVGFAIYLEKSEAEDRFGEGKCKDLEYKSMSPSEQESDDQKSTTQKARIWELWHKKDKKVYWYSNGKLLDEKDDPLNLDGFWPCPKPFLANPTTKLFVPKADFVINQDTYNQIDEIYERIRLLTKAVKVVGVYDAANQSMSRLFESGMENRMVPVDSWAMFAEKGGMRGAVDWFPVETVVGVLDTLKGVLSDQMGLLFELTGMSDVMRGGNTDQYTSDGTNQLKAKFGSIEIQALQDEFARFASDLQALKAEIVAKHYTREAIIKQSGARFLPQADHAYIEPAIELIQSQEMKWRINIRPESIAMIDYAQLKAERTEYLTAMATYLQSAQAMIKVAPAAAPALAQMMKWAMAGFKGSDELEGMMDQLIDSAAKQPPQQDDSKAQAESMKLQIAQLDLQKTERSLQGQMLLQKQKSADRIQEMLLDAQKDGEAQNQIHTHNLKELHEEYMADIERMNRELAHDREREYVQAETDILVDDNQHQNRLREIQANAALASNQRN